MDKYQKEYSQFLITDDLRKKFSELEASSEKPGTTTKSVVIETIIINEAPSFTKDMEVKNA